MYEEKKGRYSKHLDFIILDLLMLQITLIAAYALRHGLLWAYDDADYLNYGIVLGVLDLVVMYFAQSYRHILKRDALEELRATMIHMTAVVLLSVVYMFFTTIGKDFSRRILLHVWVGSIISSFAARQLLKCWIKNYMSAQRDIRHIILVATKDEAYETMQIVQAKEYRDYVIDEIALVEDGLEVQEMMGVVVKLFKQEEILAYLKNNVVDEVFINLPREVKIPEGFLEGCYQMGLTVHIKMSCRPYEVGSRVLEELLGYTVLTSGMKIAKPYEVFLKRTLDIAGGLVGTLITGILTLILAPLIYFKDPGPIFFAQTRIGKNGRKFKIYKFRSMYMNAEERKKELMAQNEMNGLMFKMTNDPRILPGIGDKIRAWSLDEFPQFINVLKGDMSLVGTRPPTVDEWEKYESHHCKRLAIKPGVTGMWQVSGRSDITDFEEVVELDSQYITEWSIGLDIKILFKTVLVVLMKSGSR